MTAEVKSLLKYRHQRCYFSSNDLTRLLQKVENAMWRWEYDEPVEQYRKLYRIQKRLIDLDLMNNDYE